MFSVTRLSVQFSGEVLFDEVSFIINKRDRVGLVGKNGAGKTTLMKIIAGDFTPERGVLSMPAGSKVGYLPQEMHFHSNTSVMDETMGAFEEVGKLEELIHELTGQITSRTDYQSDEYQQLTQRLAESSERYALLDGSTREARTEKVLLGLGFERKDLDRPLSEFSGGWQMRVELAKLLLQSPELLLLDEPTNHLDIESIQWLESFLADYPGAVMLVSHDRAFLDNITKRTIELSMGRMYDYKACYSDYELLRQERMEREIAAFNNQQRDIAQIERFITRFRAKATKARQVQSKVKLLEKMEKIEVDELDKSAIHFRFPEAPPSGKVSLEASHVSKKYGSHQVLKDLSFIIGRGERIAFVGRNGEGKTTLARILIGELEHQGQIKEGHQLKIAYFAQNQSDYLDQEKTVFQTLDDVAVGEIRKQVRNILGGFLFSGDDIDKKVKVLSGGEKARLAIAKLLLEPVNMLVLDEPTNHLDMRSKDILKNALLQFGGTIVVVSHDRDFLQGLTSKVFEFKNKQIREFMGDIYDFISTRQIESLRELEQQAGDKASAGTAKSGEGRQAYEEKKDFERRLRQLQKKVADLERDIEAKEQVVKRLEATIASPDPDPEKLSSGTLFEEYEKVKAALASLEDQWEKALLQMEELKKKNQQA